VTGTCSSGQAVAAVAQDGAVSCVGTGGPPSGSAGGDLTGSYPNPQLGAGAVNSAKVLDNSLTGADILNGTLVGGDIAANQITGAHIADAQVATADLANSVVTNAKLAPSAVGSAQVADNSLTGVDVDESTLGRVPSAQTANEAGIVVGYDHGLQAPSDPETVIIAVNGLSIGARCFFNAGNGVSIGVYAKSSAAGATLSFGGVGGANGPTPGGAFQNGLALTGTYQLLRTDAAPPASAGQGHTVVAQLIYNGGSAGMVSVQLYFSASADQTCHAEGVALPAA
jgi:hypothetical protein